MKKVYVIESVKINEVPENDQYRFVNNRLCAYAPEALAPVPYNEVRRPSFIEINDRRNPPVTVAFVPGCELAEPITDSIEKLISNSEQLYFRIKENTELREECQKLRGELIEYMEIHKDLISSFWNRLKFLFFPNSK